MDGYLTLIKIFVTRGGTGRRFFGYRKNSDEGFRCAGELFVPEAREYALEVFRREPLSLLLEEAF